MKKLSIGKLLLTPILLIIAKSVYAENIIRLGDENFTTDTLIHVTVGPGMVTTGIRLSGLDKSNISVKTNIFYTEIDLSNPNLELKGVQALDKECGAENLLNMGERKNRSGNIQYIAGVNGDHANLNGDRKRTNGIAYMDDRLYNFGVGDDNWKMFESYVTVKNMNDIVISESVTLRLPLKFPDGTDYDIHINTQRNEDYLVIYTPEHGASTRTNPWGKECTIKLIKGSIAGCDAVFEVTSEPVGDCNNNPADGNMIIPAEGYVLSGVGAAFSKVARLKTGDRLTLQPARFSVDDHTVPDITTIIGGCPLIVDNGVAITADECTRLNKTTAIQITPAARTAIGYNQERTRLIMAVTDSYKSNGHTTGPKADYGASSSGLDFVNLARFMIYLGCRTAQAMDGGGSSQLYNIGLGICNIPYGQASYLRPVANAFFAANATPDDNEVSAIEVLQKNVRLNSGETFTPKVYGYNQYGVLINTDISDFTLTVNNELGTVNGKVFTAGSGNGTTTAVVCCGDIKCGVRMTINSGGRFVSSGENAPIEVRPPYLDDDPTGFEDIFTDAHTDCPVEHFNLQGLPVDHPHEGVFIVRRGRSTEKVYLRP